MGGTVLYFAIALVVKPPCHPDAKAGIMPANSSGSGLNELELSDATRQMLESESDQRLSRIRTSWTLVFQAKQGGDAVPDAQRTMMQRYCGAIYRYLLGIVRDQKLAVYLAQ